MNTARCAAPHMPPSPDTKQDAKQDAKQEEKTLFPGGIKRILVCQLRQIGDVLLATPSIELLARHFPEAELHVLTEKKCLAMLENNPHITKVWPLDKNALPTLAHELVYYRRIAAQDFDLVVDFQQLPRCRWVVALSRAKVRLSFPPPWYLRPFYTHWAQPEPGYAAAYKAGVLAPLGIRWQGEPPRLYLTEKERSEAEGILRDMGLADKPFVNIDATHKHATRRWPARHYAALMDMLAETYPDLHFLLAYGPGEEKEVRETAALAKCAKRIAIPPFMLGLRQNAACIARARMHMGNCSSPRHMAVALDVPTATILGSTGGGWTFPSPQHIHLYARDYMPMPCQSCNANTCDRGLECLVRLTPEIIFPAVCAHLEKYGRM